MNYGSAPGLLPDADLFFERDLYNAKQFVDAKVNLLPVDLEN